MFPLAILAAAALQGGAIASGPPTVSLADFEPLIGKTLEGTLTYRDYSDGMPRSVALTAAISASQDGALEVTLVYPDEPWQNAEERLEFSPDGRMFGPETVIARIERQDGGIDFITSVEGEDDNQASEFRFVYSIADCQFSVFKNVRFLTGNAFFERNRYELACRQD